MKAFIDTNVVIDVLEEREPFYKNSYRIIQLGLEGDIETIMSAGAVKDVYYLIRRFLKDDIKARESVFLISNYIKVCNTTSEDITNALILSMPDFEDALIASAARREKADYIITRNEKDFENSPIPAITPEQFLERLNTNINTNFN
ncbi:MAG: PIN domain-containing protein [Treponema sp.]|nr:PIN domain-containing protein [Treponema sp.]